VYFYKFCNDPKLYFMKDTQVKDPYKRFATGISHWLHKTKDDVIDLYWSNLWKDM
jgi:hypothetical protein